MVFYPVNKSIPSVTMNAYENVKSVKEGKKLTGVAGIGGSYIYNRKINGLVPDGPLDPVFATGTTALVPIVFSHGYGLCVEE